MPQGQMRALRAKAGAKEARLDVIDKPKVGAQDVLIKVASAGLAPGVFTLLSLGRLSQLPTTFGHEVAGVVETVGPMVTSIQVGQRVRLHPNTCCGSCRYCATGRDHMCNEAAIIGFQCMRAGQTPLFDDYHEGGLAEYVRAPYWLVDVLPDNVSFDVGAKIHDIANAMGVLKAAELPPGSTVIITAPTGAMGTACLKLAPLFGIGHIILVGRSAERLEAVKGLTSIRCDIISLSDLGDWPTTKALVQELRKLAPDGADAIIDFMSVGSGTDIYQVMGALAVHGSFVHMGGNNSVLPLPLIAIMVNCWRIIGTRNHSRADTKAVLQLLREGRLNFDDLITHRYKLDEIDEAVARIRDRSLPVWMMVVHP